MKEAVPSEQSDLVRALAGARIHRLTRYAWDPPVGPALGRSRDVFSFSAGPLLITLDSGVVIGAASQPSLMSVTLWLERDLSGRGAARTDNDPGVRPIEADDPELSTSEMRSMLGRRIESVHLLRREAEKAIWRDRPREVGLVLLVQGGGELILSHGLHDDSDDFSVLTRDQIKPSLRSRLRETPLL